MNTHTGGGWDLQLECSGTARRQQTRHKSSNQHASSYVCDGVVERVKGMGSAHPLNTVGGLLVSSSASSYACAPGCRFAPPFSHGSLLSRCEQQ